MKTLNKQGLTTEEVQQRQRDGLINTSQQTRTKSYQEIIRDNLFTLFNLINLILAILVLLTREYKNLLFLGVIISNLVIGIAQEIRVKRVLDKLSFLVEQQVTVIRDGEELSLAPDQLVMDDLVILSSGDQITSDSKVVEGTLEVNESMITGESNAIVKQPGDFLYSGSFVVANRATVQVVHVGSDNYINKLASNAKHFTKHHSELRDSLNQILKVVGIIIIPIGLLSFAKQFFLAQVPWKEALLSTVAGVLGMVPEGLILLTSVALAISVIRLAQMKTLVQELYCIETLARVDTLCLDKTGTLTTGEMKVETIRNLSKLDLNELLGNLLHAFPEHNMTLKTIAKEVPEQDTYQAEEIIPFSSSRKFSGVHFKKQGSYLLGAFDILFPHQENEEITSYTKEGKRVIVVASQEEKLPTVSKELSLLGYVVLTEEIREDAKDTIGYFYEQGVTLKIISGDNPFTVQKIAEAVGIKTSNDVVDCSQLSEEESFDELVESNTIFARVTPNQKKSIIEALQRKKHTTAMTGDGVNDILALKSADCSIAMASGSQATKNMANLVLLDNRFASLPAVVYEGRRVINNIQRSSSLFLVKTLFSTFLSILLIFFASQYPFYPIQLTLISSLTIGVPAFLLALESNKKRIEGNFIKNVFSNALPGALCVVFIISTLSILVRLHVLPETVFSTMSVILTGFSGLIVVTRVSFPFTIIRAVMVVLLTICFFGIVLLVPDFFSLVQLSFNQLIILVILMGLIPFMNEIFTKIVKKTWK